MNYIHRYDEIIEYIGTKSNISFMDSVLHRLLYDEGQMTIADYLGKQQSLYMKGMNISNTSINIDDTSKLMTSIKMICLSCLLFLKNETGRDVNEIMHSIRDLFIRKNSDYGNSFEDFSLIGILVRMNDKINRLKCLYSKNENLVKDESIIDTIEDLYNYSVISMMYGSTILSE
jgi:hypothetical protein